YVPVRDFRFFVADMKAHRQSTTGWSAGVEPKDLRRMLRRVRENGPLTITDIKDDVLVDKDHPWASRKPSKQALQAGFYNGQLMIARRDGMLKTYELTKRHFGWDRLPRPATVNQIHRYVLDRALRAQGIVSLDSICHLNAPAKVAVKALIDKEVRAGRLNPVTIGETDLAYWARPETLDQEIPTPALTHILSP
ncbi:MAG: winged helix DNA-binding domain-containing protein, partial [bacterium]|nr:winged helix DNA-binding domain-containing protein [bacterium]